MLRSLVIGSLAAVLSAGTALAAQPLVDADWLKAHLADDGVVVLDLREPAKDGDADPYLAGHIPGAVPAPYGKSGWRTTVDGVPGMLPSETEIEALLGGLGVDNDDHVVIVSDGRTSTDFGAAARVYWTLKVMGHQEKSILDGGQAGWEAAGGPTEEGPAPEIVATTYDATFDASQVATLADVQAAQANGTTLVDARPVGQYTGAEVPGNVGVAGTIAGAVSLPHDVLVKDGRHPIDAAALGSLRKQVGIGDGGDEIAFCNTGHWASVGWFMLNEVGGNKNVRLYDGSMVEWAKTRGEPTEVGASRTVAQ